MIWGLLSGNNSFGIKETLPICWEKIPNDTKHFLTAPLGLDYLFFLIGLYHSCKTICQWSNDPTGIDEHDLTFLSVFWTTSIRQSTLLWSLPKSNNLMLLMSNLFLQLSRFSCFSSPRVQVTWDVCQQWINTTELLKNQKFGE